MTALKTFLSLVVVAASLYVLTASAAWSWRNPKGNRTTFLRHLPTALKFGRVAAYQR